MDEKPVNPPPKGVGTDDATEYSASKAPETKAEAEEPETYSDFRLIPGGLHGARVEIGMSAMDRRDVPSEAREPGLTRYGESPKAPQ